MLSSVRAKISSISEKSRGAASERAGRKVQPDSRSSSAKTAQRQRFFMVFSRGPSAVLSDEADDHDDEPGEHAQDRQDEGEGHPQFGYGGEESAGRCRPARGQVVPRGEEDGQRPEGADQGKKAAEKTGKPAPQIIPLPTYGTATEYGITFTALPANHATGDPHEQALIYLLQKDRLRVLYATDTGGLPANATQAIGIDNHVREANPIHGLIMECTFGEDEEDWRFFTHSGIKTVLHTFNVLSKTKRYLPAEGQSVYLTHLARTLHGSQAELDANLPAPLKAAYDGLEITFRLP